jgi:hypothetical protein
MHPSQLPRPGKGVWDSLDDCLLEVARLWLLAFIRHSDSGKTPRPKALPVVPDAIPAALRELPRWVVWKYALKKDGKDWTKEPYNARTGGRAKSNDSSTWSSFDAALAAYRKGGYDGIGIILGKLDDGRTLAGLDLDDVRDPDTGKLNAWATWAVRCLDSYAEVSPSATGVKGLCWGELPIGRRDDSDRGVEMYVGGRYFALTGHRLDGAPGEVMERPEALRCLHAELLPEKQNGRSDRDERTLALEALAHLNTARAVNYRDWLAVGMALHAVDSTASMLEEWDNWSRSCPDKYTDGFCAAKWATFSGHALGLGSLIYWAGRDSGWQPPRGGAAQSRSDSGPAPEKDQASGDKPKLQTGYQIILAYFHRTYAPTFKRGAVLYSGALGREVKAHEALLGPPAELLDLLAGAADAPRDKHGVDTQALPNFFATWSRSAWVDLISPLPEEDACVEINDTAQDQFHATLKAALSALVALGSREYGAGKAEVTDVERRSLIDWCCRFAKPGRWARIRSLYLWVRREPSGDGDRLAVALRVELFSQTRFGGFGRLTQNKFGRLATLYGAGQDVGNSKVCGVRCTILAPEFIDELLAGPADA